MPTEDSREIVSAPSSESPPDAHPSPRPLDSQQAVDQAHGLPDDPLGRLTRTVAAASAAGEWDIVKAALEELRAWRLEEAGANVVPLDARKRGQR